MNLRSAVFTLRRASDLLQRTSWKQEVSILSSYNPDKRVLYCQQPQIIRCITNYPIPPWETPFGQKIIRFRRRLGFNDYLDSRYNFFAQEIYFSVDAINFDFFFKEFEFEDTFQSWFVILELHMWMLLVRARALDENEGPVVARFITKEMWRDVEARAAKLEGFLGRPLKRGIQELYEQMVAAVAAYDEGILSSDTVLAHAVWRRFLAGESENIKHVDALVNYVRRTVQHFDLLSREEFMLQQKITWLPFYEK